MRLFNNIWEREKGFIWMLAIAVITLATTQLTQTLAWEGKFIVRAGFFFITIIAIHSSSLSKIGKSVGYGIGAAILALAIVMIPLETQGLNLLYTTLVTGYMIFVIVLVFKQIFTGETITVKKIGGGIAVYILLGHLWATLYLDIYIIEPHSFHYGGQEIRADEALKHLSYFSFITLTTTGYGDIIAINPVARIFVMLEGLVGQLFPAIFIAKLVSLQLEHSRKK